MRGWRSSPRPWIGPLMPDALAEAKAVYNSLLEFWAGLMAFNFPAEAGVIKRWVPRVTPGAPALLLTFSVKIARVVTL